MAVVLTVRSNLQRTVNTGFFKDAGALLSNLNMFYLFPVGHLLVQPTKLLKPFLKLLREPDTNSCTFLPQPTSLFLQLFFFSFFYFLFTFSRHLCTPPLPCIRAPISSSDTSTYTFQVSSTHTWSLVFTHDLIFGATTQGMRLIS